MASIREEITVQRTAAEVWDAIADAGAIHERLARGFVTDTQLDGDTRRVTFASGAVVRELLVDIDDSTRRLAYSIFESRLDLRHHHSSMQVFADGADACRLVWIADVAPDAVADVMAPIMRAGAGAMRDTLEGTATGSITTPTPVGTSATRPV